MTEPISKEEVKREQPVAIPRFPPFFVMVLVALAWLLTHPKQLARGIVSLAFGFVAFGVVFGFLTHMGIDAFKWTWDLWGKL